MYIEAIPNRNSPPAILLRESFREGGKVKKRTLANLSKLPKEVIDAIKAALKGDVKTGALDEAFEIVRTIPHGHVAAVVGTGRALGLPRLLAYRRSKERDLVEAMVATRLISPKTSSKLATARGLQPDTTTSSLGEVLGIESVTEDDLYEAMDWLLPRQSAIEAKLAERHLEDGTLVLYDVTSVYFEGRSCELAKLGYSRDGKHGKLQIVVGLLCNSEGCPIAVEVFEGNTADPNTLASQIEKVRTRFGLTHVVFVGDRGMLTSARIREELEPVEGLEWITALRAPQIRKLAEGVLQPSLFDETDLAEITHPDYPGERLIACRNPLLAAERERKRNEMLDATEAKLIAIQGATQRDKRQLKGKDKIGMRVGRVLERSKMGKHFTLYIDEDSFEFERNTESINREAALDGMYVIRTSVPNDVLTAEQSVSAYKGLSVVERAFRCTKTVDLQVRPINHRLPDRVRAHVFICLLAYYVEWNMRQRLAPLLFEDHDREAANEQRSSVVARARRSPAALKKASTKKTEDGYPVQSFQCLLRDLATIAINHIEPRVAGGEPFKKLTRPTRLQTHVFELLGVKLKM